MKITKQYIEENMLTVTGKLNRWETVKVKETTEELYIIYHNIKESTRCECGNITKFQDFVKGYREFCSPSCGAKSKKSLNKSKQTFLLNYGVDHPMKSTDVLRQVEETCLKEYGYSNTFKVPKFKEKIKESNIKNNGVEYPMQSNDIQKKSKQTKLDKFGDENYNNMTKHKQTKLDKYDDENYNNREQSKETCLEIYGVEYPSQLSITKEKSKKTSLKNWGYESHMQSGLFGFGYKHKTYIYPSGKVVKVQGYEPKLLDDLVLVYEENEILTDKKDMPEFWYYKDDKKHRYFPDVYIPKDNLIYEVKSDWTLKQTKKNGIYDLKKQSVIDAGFSYVLRIY